MRISELGMTVRDQESQGMRGSQSQLSSIICLGIGFCIPALLPERSKCVSQGQCNDHVP